MELPHAEDQAVDPRGVGEPEVGADGRARVALGGQRAARRGGERGFAGRTTRRHRPERSLDGFADRFARGVQPQRACGRHAVHLLADAESRRASRRARRRHGGRFDRAAYGGDALQVEGEGGVVENVAGLPQALDAQAANGLRSDERRRAALDLALVRGPAGAGGADDADAAGLDEDLHAHCLARQLDVGAQPLELSGGGLPLGGREAHLDLAPEPVEGCLEGALGEARARIFATTLEGVADRRLADRKDGPDLLHLGGGGARPQGVGGEQRDGDVGDEASGLAKAAVQACDGSVHGGSPRLGRIRSRPCSRDKSLAGQEVLTWYPP